MKQAGRVICALLFIASGSAGQIPSGRGDADSGVHRVRLVQQRSVEILRVTREPGSIEPAGTHPFDVVIVPLGLGRMDLTVGGKRVGEWKVGQAFFIPRNTEHHFANVGAVAADYLTLRIP